MTVLNLRDLLIDLANERPVFHNEADFQLALAGKIKTCHPDAEIRLEYRPLGKERLYADIWITTATQEHIMIELKYTTRAIALLLGSESFDLLDQGAQDIRRSDFLKGIMCIEQVAAERKISKGYAVFLTNDRTMWLPPRTSGTVDAAFRLHQGRTVSGYLDWAPHVSSGTKKTREESITLENTYFLTWHDYSKPSSTPFGEFKYLLLTVEIP